MGIFQKETQEHKKLPGMVTSGQWNWVCGWKRDMLHCTPPVLFEFAFQVHENIIFRVTKKVQKTHLANECMHRKKKMSAYIYRFKKPWILHCILERIKINITSVQRVNYRTTQCQISMNKWFVSSFMRAVKAAFKHDQDGAWEANWWRASFSLRAAILLPQGQADKVKC